MATESHPPIEDAGIAWRVARRHGMSRRRFCALLAGGGVAAVAAACLPSAGSLPAQSASPVSSPAATALQATAAPPPTPLPTAAPAELTATTATVGPAAVSTAGATAAAATPAPSATPTAAATTGIYPPNGRLVVDPVPEQFFRPIGSANFEMRFENLAAQNKITTPNSFFFVRCHDTSVFVDSKPWKLRIEGDGIDKPFELTYDELLKLPSTTVTRYVECAGNGRSFYATMLNKPAQGGQWHLGAWGVASWTGVTFAELLQRAGIKKTAVQVMPVGLDKPKVARPMPVAKAMEPDTILAYMMNGDILPPDHGFPVRAIVPGWVGVNNVKWVGSIQVSEQPLWTDYNTKLYVMVGPDYKPEAPGDGPPVNDQVLKSALALPWPATIPPGQQKIAGYAWSPAGKIAKVEISLDGGKTWQPASLTGENIERAGTRFEFMFNATPGEMTITPRATDDKGHTQPPLSEIKWNQQGYIFAAPVPHPVTVSANVTKITAATATPTPPVTATAVSAAQAPSTPAAATAGTAAVTRQVAGAGAAQTAATLAAAGATVYAANCTACHGAKGEGVTGPSLIGANANLPKYGDAAGLYAFIQKNMPANAPGTLSQEQYLQVTAYMLLQNNIVKPDTQLGTGMLGGISLKR
jgi:sulfane dehydrogenase subunit SoxC